MKTILQCLYFNEHIYLSWFFKKLLASSGFLHFYFPLDSDIFSVRVLIKNLYISESKTIPEVFPIVVQQVRLQFPTCISDLILNHPLGAQTGKTCVTYPAVMSQFRNQLDSEMMAGKNDAVLQGGIYNFEIGMKCSLMPAHSLMLSYFLVSFLLF